MTPYLASLMRFIDSSTLVTSFGVGQQGAQLTGADETRCIGAAVDRARLRRHVDHAGGAIEFPPETELSVPIRSSSAPRAPACQMPYIGLCGLVLVSFCESAGMMVPVTLARPPRS